jgi:hypothetical protein
LAKTAGQNGDPDADGRRRSAMMIAPRLSSDVKEIKLVFSISPHRPDLNITPR